MGEAGSIRQLVEGLFGLTFLIILAAALFDLFSNAGFITVIDPSARTMVVFVVIVLVVLLPVAGLLFDKKRY